MRGKRVLPALKDKNLWKILRENDKSWLDLDRSKRESQKVFEKVWILKNTWRKHVFKKPSDRFSIDKKRGLIDRKLVLIDLAPIEAGKFKPKSLIAISISRETGSIDRKSGKNKFLKNKAILCRNTSKHNILWIKCMSMRWNVFQKHLYWTQISQK